MCETRSENIDMNYQNISMFLDMSAAFGCISHATLVKKMELYKYGNKATQLIPSYLSYGSQYVEINGKKVVSDG